MGKWTGECVAALFLSASAQALDESSDVGQFNFPTTTATPFLGVQTAGPGSERTSRWCQHTRGGWCEASLSQTPVEWLPSPEGNITCTNGCNGVGRCDYDTGTCRCTVGWTGADCSIRQDRLCQRPPTTWAEWQSFQRLPGLCAGHCDTNLGFCFCNNGTFGHVEDTHGIPFMARPGKQGRPLSWHFQPGLTLKDPTGRAHRVYGGVRTHHIWDAETGWCNSANPERRSPCHLENLDGEGCDSPRESTCLNQCMMNGDCHLGFCKCHEGWYGEDCSRRRQGSLVSPKEGSPWQRRHARSLVLEHALSGQPRTRRRPLIYVYDMDSLYTSKMLQWRHIKEACVSRFYSRQNQTHQIFSSYMLEFALHEMILQSEHLTRNPDEADYFFVLIYESCFIWPIHGHTLFPYFFEDGVSIGPGMGWTDGRTINGMYMFLAAQRWLRSTFPFWDRRNGTDHIIMSTHDEGSCWVPNELRNAILLTHWAPIPFPQASKSAWPSDRYSHRTAAECSDPQHNCAFDIRGVVERWRTRNATQYKSGEHLPHLFGAPCFDPNKDIAVPGYKPAYTYARSPLLGNPSRERNILLFLRGDMGKSRLSSYSGGVRQQLLQLAVKGAWAERYNISIGDRRDVPGDGFSMRAEDAMLHGCIPVVIMDNILPVWSPHLDWSAFSVRVAQADLPTLPQTLRSLVRSGKAQELQSNVANVWERFTYSSYFPFDQDIRLLRHRGWQEWIRQGRPHHQSPPAPEWGHTAGHDAFSTLMQILYGKLVGTRRAGLG